jgi:hypothetical protein
MFLHGGKRHVVVRGELAHGRVGVHDPRQDVATRGVGERPEQLVQGVRGWVATYNHLVVYSSTKSGGLDALAECRRGSRGRERSIGLQVLQGPVLPFHTRDSRTLIATAHRNHYLRSLCQI